MKRNFLREIPLWKPFHGTFTSLYILYECLASAAVRYKQDNINVVSQDIEYGYIRLSEKFLSFHEEIIDAQGSLFYIILSNYVRSILFYRDKHFTDLVSRLYEGVLF